LTPDSLVVFLHGVDANGADLAPLAEVVRPFLPRAAFASPDAPNRSDRGPGRQWFSLMGITEVNRPGRVEAARAAFDGVVAAQLEAFGFAGRPERVALVGFSQGAIMALDALASGRRPLGATVALSGRFASPPPFAPKAGARALLIHGESDRVIPAEATRQATRRLRDLGVAVESHVLPGVGHAISPEAIALVGDFLKRILA